MKPTSISKKLLTRVLSFYFILTFIVTGIQIFVEYTSTKSNINVELLTLEKTFSGSLTRALWELNTKQIIDIADGLVSTPMIEGISILDENNEIIVQLGQLSNNYNKNNIESYNIHEISPILPTFSKGVFGHTFPLVFEFSGRESHVGSVTIVSSNDVIFDRIEVGIYFLIINAMVKTAVLVLLFSWAFTKLLTVPLNQLTQQIQDFNIDDPEASKLYSMNYDENELAVLEHAYNHLIDELTFYQNRLINTQRAVVIANMKLDEQNLQLEQDVAKKTSSLSSSMLNMELQKQEMLVQQNQLKEENSRRKKTEETLLETNKNLKHSILELNNVHERLLNSEKMIGLGRLSTEMAHEVHTPINVSITSTSYLSDLLSELTQKVEDKELTKKLLSDFLHKAFQSTTLLTNNLNKASNIITSYKLIASDQMNNKLKKINVFDYISDIIHSLQPKLKNTHYDIRFNCPKDIEINTYPGSLSQIIMNLVINSIIYGFEEASEGTIVIEVTLKKDTIQLHYQDNGKGLNQTRLQHIFEPSHTIKDIQSGLSTHAIYAIVTDTLNGNMSAYSELGSGVGFIITFDNIT